MKLSHLLVGSPALRPPLPLLPLILLWVCVGAVARASIEASLHPALSSQPTACAWPTQLCLDSTFGSDLRDRGC
jgi:hypothetical protein